MMNQARSFLSIVISAHNEEQNLIELYQQIIHHTANIPGVRFEFVFVNDGSTDHSLPILKDLLSQDTRIKIVNLIRNFGHELAMTAGMDYAQGDGILFMDADLQHPPALISELVREWRKGYDIVLTRRVNNEGQTKWQEWKSRLFYKILNKVSDTYIAPQAPDFRLIDKKYINVVRTMKENNRMLRGLVSWLGVSNQVTLDFVAPARFAGESKYTFVKLLKLAIDSVVSFSIKPLRIATYIGITSALVSIALGIWFVFDFLTSETYQFTGYGTTVVMVIFIGSVELIVLGIIGEYLGRIHLEVKNRPLYIAEYFIRLSED